MKTVGKALLWSVLIVLILIALPLLAVVFGLALPVVLTVAAIIFPLILLGIILGKNSKD